MNKEQKTVKFSDAISDAVMVSLTDILKPLIERWEKDLDHGKADEVLGLQKAIRDVQLIIDTAKQRMTKHGG